MTLTNLNNLSIDWVVKYIGQEVDVSSAGTNHVLEVSRANVVTQEVKSRCATNTVFISLVHLTAHIYCCLLYTSPSPRD